MKPFDAALERLCVRRPELTRSYLTALNGVMITLAEDYCRRDEIEAAYFPYIIKKYQLLGGADDAPRRAVEDRRAELQAALEDPNADLAAMEKDKIKGAVRTDFILSAEIIAITLGAVAQADFWTQLAVLVGIALIMTVGVYGLVGGIVKLDDLGLYLSQKASSAAQAVGRGILWLAPWLMKFLSVAGTAAMFLVCGGILVHGIPALHHLVAPYVHGALGWLVSNGYNAVVGILAGIVVLLAVSAIARLRKPTPAAPAG